MMSSGGLTSAKLFAGKDAILSGPAGGVVAMARTGASAGFRRVIGFDMGGTSTDVAHFDGEFERAFETEVAGVRMRAPMMKIHTVAAGGGSILHFDGARFRVGPDSAGADPGPACYRRGGPLAVTDANLMTGKLIPDFFPEVFGPDGDQPLDGDIVRERFEALAREIGDGREPEAVADGFLAIAVAKMAEAIKTISVARGYDVTRYALNCFGGAGGQHACDVADALGDHDRAHPSAVVAALGLRHGARRHRRPARARGRRAARRRGARRASARRRRARRRSGRGGRERRASRAKRSRSTRRAQLRYAGSDTTIEVALASAAAMRRAFETAHKSALRLHRSRQGARHRGGVGRGGRRRGALRRAARRPRRPRAPPTPGARDALLLARRLARGATSILREALPLGARVDGPALIIEPHQTIVVEQGWRAAITAKNHVVLDARRSRCRGARRSAPRPIRSCSRSSTISSCRSPSRWA